MNRVLSNIKDIQNVFSYIFVYSVSKRGLYINSIEDDWGFTEKLPECYFMELS